MSVRAKFSMSVANQGWQRVKNVLKSVEQSKSYVIAGVVGAGAAKDEGGGMTSGSLALIHEFGAPAAGIPARPFVMASFRKHKAEYVKALGKLVENVVQGKMDYEQGLGMIGARMAYDMKAYVTQGPQIPPPNAPAVLRRKLEAGSWKKTPGGAPRTLVDTGRMVGSLTWVVRKGGDK